LADCWDVWPKKVDLRSAEALIDFCASIAHFWRVTPIDVLNMPLSDIELLNNQALRIKDGG
jgi:hypothetical protein